MKRLTPAEQSVLDAIGQSGHANYLQLVEATGRARSTVDKAINVLSKAAMIVEYDTGADPAEGAPTQWQLAEDDASAPIGADADDATNGTETTVDEHAGPGDDDAHELDTTDDEDDEDEPEDEEDEDEDDDESYEDDSDGDGDGDEADGAEPVLRAGNRRILIIAGALSYHPEGATADELTVEADVPEPALSRLLAAMVAGGAAEIVPTEDGLPPRWKTGTVHAAHIDPFPPKPRCEQCLRNLPAGWTPPAASTEAGEGNKAPDQKVLMLAGSMFPYGEGGASAAQLAKDSRLTQELVTRLLQAMEAAGRAERVITDGDGEQAGEPLWVLKPGPLNTVDPEPKCTGCGRPKPGVRSSRTTPTGTRRADALPRNVLKEATLQFILGRPGVVLSPGKIAAALAIELNRDVISPGAVKNNCEGFATEGKILQVSSPPKPWLFSTLPAGENVTSTDDTPPAGGDSGEQDTAA